MQLTQDLCATRRIPLTSWTLPKSRTKEPVIADLPFSLGESSRRQHVVAQSPSIKWSSVCCPTGTVGVELQTATGAISCVSALAPALAVMTTKTSTTVLLRTIDPPATHQEPPGRRTISEISFDIRHSAFTAFRSHFFLWLNRICVPSLPATTMSTSPSLSMSAVRICIPAPTRPWLIV